MPIYEYQCRKCGHKFEKLIKSMHSTEPAPCPECHSRQTERALSTFAVGAETGSKPAGAPHQCCGGCCGGGGQCALE